MATGLSNGTKTPCPYHPTPRPYTPPPLAVLCTVLATFFFFFFNNFLFTFWLHVRAGEWSNFYLIFNN